MSERARAIAFGLAWIVLSPLALLMAAIPNATSDTVYAVHLLVFGAWTVAGLVAGIGTMASAGWARRLKTLLWSIAAVYFAGTMLVAAVYLVVARMVEPVFALVVALIAGSIGAVYVLLARRRARQNAYFSRTSQDPEPSDC